MEKTMLIVNSMIDLLDMPHVDPIKRREYQKFYQKKWREENKDKWSEILSKSDLKRRNTPRRKLSIAEVRMRVLHRNKTKVLSMYGKSCAWCLIDRYEVLTVDHVNNDGKRHRAEPEYKKYSNMWGFLAKSEFRPDLFQILCWNCNMAKSLYKVTPLTGYRPFEFWVELSKKKNI